jgi:hypothetical protein
MFLKQFDYNLININYNQKPHPISKIKLYGNRKKYRVLAEFKPSTMSK